MIDVGDKKNRIISFMKISGPSLPVRVAREIQMDPVFASAILSELLNEKRIRISSMKVGSSPLYFIPGDEKKLEDHTDNLKPLEKEAYLKLKDKKILIDEDETPAIRVALRGLKDFAVPFRFQEKIFWKYAFTENNEIQEILKRKEKPKEENKKGIKHRETKPEKEKPSKKEMEKIFESDKKQAPKKKSSAENFLKQVENFLGDKDRTISSIEEVDKRKVIAKIKSGPEISLLFAFKKSRITDAEIMKCYKHAKDSNLPYQILILKSPTKKMTETIDAYKKLKGIETLE